MTEQNKEKEKNPLFSEFPIPLKEDWFRIVAEDLEGGDFDRKLVWKTEEGFSAQPLYFPDSMIELSHAAFYPGEAPFVRGAASLPSDEKPWSICQSLSTPDPAEANRELLDSLKRGQHGCSIRFDRAAVLAERKSSVQHYLAVDGVCVQSLDDMAVLLRDVPAKAEIELRGGLSSLLLLGMALEVGITPHHVDFDPISRLLIDGSLPMSFEDCMALAANTIRSIEASTPTTSIVSASGECFHNAGATAVQEIAFTLAAGVEYLDALSSHGIDTESAAKRMGFTFAAGTNFFMEIAKLRAARALWSKILFHFDENAAHCAPMRMHVRTSWRQQTKYDPWVNMLRGTVESMAAALGGADSIYTAPYDEAVTAPGAFSKRIARNVQIILQEEAHLGQTVDPAGGSYYIEELTASLAEHAWTLFQSVEKEGGLLQAAKSGSVQTQVLEAAGRKQQDMAGRKSILIGTNQYPNPTEAALEQNTTVQEMAGTVRETVLGKISRKMDLEGAPDATRFESLMDTLRSGAALSEIFETIPVTGNSPNVTPLPQVRAAYMFEKLRDAVESSPAKPVIFLATLGPVFWRRARATFASGFFGTAGLTVIDNPGFASPEEACDAARQAGADIVVICSDDESYGSVVPTMVRTLKSTQAGMQIVVAGYPKDNIDALRAAGVDQFIHVKADVAAVLASMLENFGIDQK
ncbi:MAG: acyl-CoA mutase large subunit family protein [Bacteroidia bacterium]|nr:acyl-CoA mutase large subunit family protein [Bacteroidia bacterium]